MKSLALRHRVLTIGVAAALLAGCGAAQPPTGAPGAMVPQTTSSHVLVASASYGDYLYVSTKRMLYVLTYPNLKKVGTARVGYGEITASDPNTGNVIIGVCEFSRGTTKPFAELNPGSGNSPYSVAFDPTTDNIAYSINEDGGRGGWVAVYKDLTSVPSVYADPNFATYGLLVYDNHGNLFALGRSSSFQLLFAELPKGESQFTDVALNSQISSPSNILWDGQYVVIRDRKVLYRITVTGSTMKIAGLTTLGHAYSAQFDRQFWIQGNMAMGPVTSRYRGRFLALWHYPDGGSPYQVLKNLGNGKTDFVFGVTVSVAPSGSHIQK
jgi:hypothetical protein